MCVLALGGFIGCDNTEPVKEVEREGLSFASPGREVQAWVYEKNFVPEKPWISRLVGQHSELNRIYFEDIEFPGDGNDYYVKILSPGRAPYFFSYKERDGEMKMNLYLLGDDPVPEEIVLEDEIVAIIHGKVNKKGKPELTGPDVEEFRYGLKAGGVPKWIGVDYQGRQSKMGKEYLPSEELFLDNFRRKTGMGLAPAPDRPIASFDMVPEGSLFEPIDILLKEDDVYYFRTHGLPYFGVFRVVSVGKFTQEDVRIYQDYKRY